MRLAVAAIGSALALGIAPAARAPSPVDPCSLLTTAQVSSAVGAPVQTGKPINTTGCSWTAASTKVMVTISFFVPGGYDKAKAANVPTVVKTTVGGVGDDAFYASMGAWTILTVKKGQTAFSVRVYGVTDQAKVKEIEKTLGADAAARM